MENKTVVSIEEVIDYIEANLDGKLDLEMVAEAVHPLRIPKSLQRKNTLSPARVTLGQL